MAAYFLSGMHWNGGRAAVYVPDEDVATVLADDRKTKLPQQRQQNFGLKRVQGGHAETSL